MRRRRAPSRICVMLAAMLAALLTGAPAAPALDCSFGGCVDVERLPGGTVNLTQIVQRAQKFFKVTTKVYLVRSSKAKAWLPYMLAKAEPFVMTDQIHIPDAYHAITEVSSAGKPHFVWHYIIGHEMAHAYQQRTGILAALVKPTDTVLLAELQADYLAGFFMGAAYNLPTSAIAQLRKEIKGLPSGAPGAPNYHGRPGDRFFITTQGALHALAQPRPSLASAAKRGLACAIDILETRRSGGRSLARCGK
ncbi:MAG: hypothetical protein MRY74_09245 [Neomegalonema sp.]|nr:hypothetical protein [Neomegalonema sp.]